MALDLSNVGDLVAKHFAPKKDHPYLHRPVEWVQDTLNEFLWSKQRAVLESVRDNRETFVPSCHDSGKSFIAARAAAWWISVHPPGTAKVVSTAPSFPQVEGILWQEIGTAYAKGKLPGRVTRTQWNITARADHYLAAVPGEYLAGFGRKPSDNNPVGFSGIHAEHVLFIIDEADGVAESMYGASRTALTNEGARLLCIGNPDNPSSTFADRIKADSADVELDEYWATPTRKVIRIDGLKTPNFTDEVVPDALRPMLLSPTWVRETIEIYGEDSPYYIAKVRGRHPKDASTGVIPNSWLRSCMFAKELDPRAVERMNPVELGIDVGASATGDQTVIRERRGNRVGRVWRYREADHTKLYASILGHIQETGATSVKIDANGVGHGITDFLRAAGQRRQHRATIHDVMSGASAMERTKFVDIRAEMYWGFRELTQQQAVDLEGLEEDVIAELVAPSYKVDGTGRIRVGTKDELRARLKRSPDDADALLLAFYSPQPVVQPSYISVED